MACLRDNADYQDIQFQRLSDDADPGLSYRLTFDPGENLLSNTTSLTVALSAINKPKVAILRDQGVNGASEMAFAVMSAGFNSHRCAHERHNLGSDNSGFIHRSRGMRRI